MFLYDVDFLYKSKIKSTLFNASPKHALGHNASASFALPLVPSPGRRCELPMQNTGNSTTTETCFQSGSEVMTFKLININQPVAFRCTSKILNLPGYGAGKIHKDLTLPPVIRHVLLGPVMGPEAWQAASANSHLKFNDESTGNPQNDIRGIP